MGGGEAGDEEEEAVRAGGVPGAAGLPAGQRVHPPPLPLRVAAPAGAALRLLHPQRDPQRLDASYRIFHLSRSDHIHSNTSSKCSRYPELAAFARCTEKG